MGIKKTRQQHGFTIIELSLFFAVSGLLLVTMLTGIGLAVQRQRFTDAVNGSQSFLQQQYNETQITINDRGATSDCGSLAKGASGCLVIGKIVDLGDPTSTTTEETTINSYFVIIDQKAADDAMNADTPPSDLVFLNLASTITRAVKDTGNDQQYIVPWGAKLGITKDSGGSATPSGGSDVRYILILRSPINGLISTYKLSSNANLFQSGNSELLANGSTTIEDFGGDISNRSIKSCLKSADLMNVKAFFKITPGSTQDSITTQFDTPEKSQWCDI